MNKTDFVILMKQKGVKVFLNEFNPQFKELFISQSLQNMVIKLLLRAVIHRRGTKEFHQISSGHQRDHNQQHLFDNYQLIL